MAGRSTTAILLIAAMILSVAARCRLVRATLFSPNMQQSSRLRFRRPLSLRATEVRVEEYIASIEDELRRCGPITKRSISRPNRKPMIRTLLGYKTKIDFDEAIRKTRRCEEHRRLSSFWGGTLAPILSKDRSEKALTSCSLIDEALHVRPDAGKKAFRRLGSGRDYKGNVLAMLQDIAPETLPHYFDASQPIDERQAMQLLIESHRSNVDAARIDAARKCLDEFLPQKNNESQYVASQQNGRDSEKACIDFLNENRQPGSIILENVLVNHKSCRVRQKYRKGTLDESSGIIWTGIGRDRFCSEFDAVVITAEDAANGNKQENQTRTTVTEIWEAKYSVSPSTLYDAVAKKLPAARAVIKDDEAILSYNGGSVSMGRSYGEDEPKTVFGIYGRGLLPAPNAVSQLRAMAVANILHNDDDALLEAAESGFVMVDTTRCIEDLNVLREQLKKISDFELTVRIQERK
mmetsp:Transcript_31743/g.95010  ORF Transcript_31743/g.95010 Transcript_31743/m.95010 type:complete len:464 (-) Transcript_31743:114-1505(-)